MANDYSWNIGRQLTYDGSETFAWVVVARANGKIVISAKELSRAAAVLAAMKAIQQFENLSSAVRLFVLDWARDRASAQTPKQHQELVVA